MIPPWAKHPELPAGRVGWRMGYGEQYMNDFWKWFSRSTDDDRAEVERAYPEPEGWSGFYARIKASPWL